jgi:drug/metabolite transporter (DMT)-like permease
VRLSLVVFLAALGSAILHATWNAAARRRADPGHGFAVIIYAGGVVAAPLLLITGLPDPKSFPWLAGSLAFNLLTMRSMMAAYRRAPFAVSYPIARGLTPPLVALAAAIVTSELPSRMGLLGIATISIALVMLAGRALRLRETPVSGVLLAAASSVFAAGYVFMDAQGVRASGSVLAYGAAVPLLNGIALGALGAAEGRPPWKLPMKEWRFGFTACIASYASYLLVLYAFTHGPTGPVAAIRETSVLFATAFAAFLLAERVGRIEWISAGLAVIGIALLRLG